MLREDLRVRIGQQGRDFRGGGFLLRGGVLRFLGLFGFFDPARLQGGPIDFLEIEIVQTVDLIGIGGAGALELCRGDGVRSRTRSEEFADGFEASGADNKFRGDGKVIEVPLGYAFAALTAVERDFQECGVAFRAFRCDLVAKNGPNELQSFGLFADSENIDGLLRIKRRAKLHRRKLSGGQCQRVRERHAKALLRYSLGHGGAVLLSRRHRGGDATLQDLVESRQIKLRFAVGNGVGRKKGKGSRRRYAVRPEVEERPWRCVAQNRALKVGLGAFEDHASAERVDRLQFQSIENGSDLEAGGAVGGQSFEARDSSKKFEHAAAKLRLCFLVGRRFGQRVALGGLPFEAPQNIFKYG